MGGIRWEDSSIEINGIMFGSVNSINSKYLTVLEKASQRVDTWKKRRLTMLGKVRLINSCLYPLLYYVAPVFPPSNDIIVKFTRLAFSLLWGYPSPELVSREVVMLDRAAGGLGLDNLRFKVDALLIKPLFTLFTGEVNACNLIFSRFFLAQRLRILYPFVWSHSRPNSSEITPTYKRISEIICIASGVDRLFYIKESVKEIVKLFCMDLNAIPLVERKTPSPEWPLRWKNTLNELLCHKLKEFSWKLLHGVLKTRVKLKGWGIGDGKCPFCKEQEDILHMFWGCKSCRTVLLWLDHVVSTIYGVVSFSCDNLLLGTPIQNLSNGRWKHIWYLFCVTLRRMWKRRCNYIFENRVTKNDEVILNVKREITERIKLDFKRWTLTRFRKVWVRESGLCSLNGDTLTFAI